MSNTAKKTGNNASDTQVNEASVTNEQNVSFFSKRRMIISIYLIFVATLVSATFYYSNSLEDDLLDASYTSLERQTEQQKIYIYQQMQEKVHSLELFAEILSSAPSLDYDVKAVGAMHGFDSIDEQLFIINTDGIGVAPFYGNINIANENYFLLAKEGKTVFSQMYYSSLGESFFIVTPIKKADKTIAYLANELKVDYLEALLNMSEADYDYTYILDRSGNTIALNANEYVLQPETTLPRVLQNMEFNEAGIRFVSSYEDFEGKFLEGINGFMEISQKNNMRLGYFTPIGINSWTIVSFLPLEAISADLRRVSKNFYIITFITLILAGVFILGMAVVYVRALGLKDKLVRELMSRAETDPLTKLYTKAEVEGRIENYLAYTAESEKSALFIIDLDNFKEVNSYFGDEYGDVILKEVAQKIKACFRASDLVARIDGNQFLAFLQNTKGEKFLPQKAELVIDTLKNTHIGNKNIVLTASIGISLSPADGMSYSKLYDKADLAMYYVKQQGKGTYAFYQKEHKKIAQQAMAQLERSSDTAHDDRIRNQFLDVSNMQSIFVSLMYSNKNVPMKFEEMLRKLTLKYNVDRAAIIEYDIKTNALTSIAELHDPEAEALFTAMHANFMETQLLAAKPLFESSAIVQVYPDITEESEAMEEKFFHSIGIQSLVAVASSYENKKCLLILSTNQSGHVWKRTDYDLIVFVARLYSLYKRNLMQ